MSIVRKRNSIYAEIQANRKLSEDILQQSQQLFRLLFEHTSDAVVVVDSCTGCIIEVNPAAEVLTGHFACEMRNQKIKDVIPPYVVQRVQNKGKTQGCLASEELTFSQPNGVKHTILISMAPGNNHLVLYMARDITKEKEADRIKTEFVSIASHEIRTPMTIIYGFVELLLKSTGLTVAQRRWLDYIYRESQRLTNIVDDLLNVSRIEMGRLSLKPGVVRLKPIIARLIADFSLHYPFHTFHSYIPEDFPGVWVDADKLTQVLHNVLDNAAKYSPNGGSVLVSAYRDDRNLQGVVTVTDCGIGIPEEELPHLFTRFHHIPRPSANNVRGAGLGLYIARSLLEMMGGKVWVESKVNKGSTFYIGVPLEQAIIK